MEYWKEIKGTDGKYFVSNYGRVKSYVKYSDGRLLKPFKINSGYLSIDLGNIKRYTVHRLVAETFIDNPLNYREVNHIDGDKLNNSIDNLEWCSPKMNMKHASDSLNMNKKRIVAMNGSCSIAVFESLKDAVITIGANYSSLSRALNKGNKCCGFVWKFF